MYIQKLKNKIFIKTVFSFIMSSSLIAIPISAHALSNANSSYFGSVSGNAACTAINSLDPNQGCGAGNGESSVDKLITTIVNIMTIIVGIIAVIMIIVSGLRFITSGGDPQKVSGAKSSLIYALVGLVVVALAQAIIHFTINNANSAVK